MRRTLIAFITLIALAGVAFTANAADRLKSGNFRGVNGVPTSGSVSIVKSSDRQKIVLSKSFKTQKGPSLWVYVGNGSPTKRIGKLKAIKGSQTYTLPPSVDIGKYSSVYIYCKPFKKTFGRARLK